MMIIEELIKLIFGKFRSVGLLLNLFKLEAKLAGLSIIPLLTYFLILGIVITALWISANTFTGYVIYYFSGSLLIALASILLLQIILGAILIKVILVNFNRMSFAKTRAFLFTEVKDADFTANSENFSQDVDSTDYNDKVTSIKSLSEVNTTIHTTADKTTKPDKSKRDNHEQKARTGIKHKITRSKNTSGTKSDT